MPISNVVKLPVSAVSSDELVRVGADTDLLTLAEALVAAEVGALAVGDDDAVTGVVSERDVVRALAERRDPATTTAGDIAHSSLVCCDANSSVADVAEEMMEQYVRHVLVEEDGRVVGIVSVRDLLGAYLAADLTEG